MKLNNIITILIISCLLLTACTVPAKPSPDEVARELAVNQILKPTDTGQAPASLNTSNKTNNAPAAQNSPPAVSTASTASLSNCEGETQPEKDLCYINLAVNSYDSTFCDKISDANKRDYCVYNLISRGQVDAVLCNRLSQSYYYNDFCYYRLAQKISDSASCGVIKDLNAKDTCYEAVAVKDESICNKIQRADAIRTSQGNKDVCLAGVAEAKGDIKICEKVLLQNEKNYCYLGVGLKLNSSDICLKISESLAKTFCLTEVALHLNDSSICQKYPDNTVMDDCYSEVAQDTRNIGLCDKIKDESIKFSCKMYVTGSLSP